MRRNVKIKAELISLRRLDHINGLYSPWEKKIEFQFLPHRNIQRNFSFVFYYIIFRSSLDWIESIIDAHNVYCISLSPVDKDNVQFYQELLD